MPVYKDKNKHWYFVVTINYKQYKRVKYKGQYMLSKAEAQFNEQEFLKEFLGINDNMSLLDLFHEYVNASKSSLKESTKLTYEKFERNYLKEIGLIEINQLLPNDILKWRNGISSLAVTSQYKNRLQNIMKSLLEYGNIMYNLNGRLQYSLLQPFKDNDVKEFNTKSKYLEIENFRLLLKPLDTKDYYYIILWTLYFTGLRIGELSALQVKDISKDHIIVNKDYSRIKGVDIIQAPKNKNSIRIIPLDRITSAMLQEYINGKEKNEIVFHKNKKYLNQQRLRRVIESLKLEAGLTDYDITPHTLRHSYSSNLKKLGYDEYTISKLMGNTPDVASKTYIHSNINLMDVSSNLEKL